MTILMTFLYRKLLDAEDKPGEMIRNKGLIQDSYIVGKVIGYGSLGEVRKIEHK